MPKQLPPEQLRVLEVAWEWTSTHGGEPPTFAALDKALDAENLDAEEVLRQVDSRVVRSTGGLPPRPGDQVSVTAFGLTYLSPAPSVLALFLSCLDFLVESERRHDPTSDEPQPVVTSDDFAAYLGRATSGIRPPEISTGWARVVGRLLHMEGRPWTQGSFEPDGAPWTATIGRAVRQFRGVATAEQYADTFPDIGQRGALATESEPVDVERPADSTQVFVVYGRNEPARTAVFAFLRALGLKPIEWEKAVEMTGKATPYVGEILDVVFGNAAAVVVVQTPDDIAYLHPSLSEADDPACNPEPQPRPNVLFEAGMAMGRDPHRTLFIELGAMRSFSDIHGRHVVRLDNSIASRQKVAGRLKTAGCAVDTSGSDWHTAGDLAPPPKPGNGLPLGRALPASERTGSPRLDARFVDNGERRLGEIEVVNHGPGDVLDLNVAVEDRQGLSLHYIEGLPVPRLPAGKSLRPVMLQQFGDGPPYLTVTVTGRTAEGTEISQDIFVSGI